MRFIRYASVLGLAAMLLLGFRVSMQEQDKQLQSWTHQQAAGLVRETRRLIQVADDFKFGRNTQIDLRDQVRRTRLAYKRIEFLWAFYYQGFCEEHLNGAPLQHIERHDSRPFVVPPQGLQVLDEMVHAENARKEASQVLILAQNLHSQTQILSRGISQRSFPPEEVSTAMRMGLVRLFTLGLTGFDTPGSLNALEEGITVLTAMKEVLPLLFPDEAIVLIPAVQAARSSLESATSFEEFDRLTFLRNHLDPLYQRLIHIQASGSNLPPMGWNPDSESLFSSAFLDPYAFTKLDKGEDGPALQTLGAKLFYDPVLSKNQQMSCASCHDPSKAFTDGKARSASNVLGKEVQRNSPTLLNAVYADRYFYDLRAFTLEQQAEHVIFNADEFNTAYEEIIAKLAADDRYKAEFKSVFNSQPDQASISSALGSYVLSLQSFNSPFDQYARGETADLPPAVKNGFNVFMGKAGCGTCHFAPTFSGLVPPFYRKNESEVLGVLKHPFSLTRKIDPDFGRIDNEVWSEKADIFAHSFKTPTIRNIALTAPYFHNGNYPSLEAVLAFYNQGGGVGMGLDIPNQTLPPDPLGLTPAEQADLMAFMQALTDTSSYKSVR